MALVRKLAKYTDQDIISGIQQGGTSRQRLTNHLYQLHANLVYKIIKQFKVDQNTAVDLYADAVVSVCLQIEKGNFKGESSIFTYLYRSYQNKCLNFLRKTPLPISVTLDEMLPLPDKARTMMQELIFQEKLEEMNTLMDQVGDKCRQILWDSEYHGYSFDEIATRIGFSSARSVSSMKHRCLKRLAALIQERTVTQ